MKSNRELSRRDLIRTGGAALATMVIARTVHADEPLSPTDPTAQALGYYDDASAVDLDKWPKKAGPGGEDQQCATCSLFVDKGDGMGGCSIFPGKLVNSAGWCNAWVSG